MGLKDFFSNILEHTDTIFDNEHQLLKLDLSSLEITSLPESIGDFLHLEKLILSNNKLKFLPEKICNLTKLQELDLRNNELITLPKHIDKLNELKKLELESTYFFSYLIYFSNEIKDWIVKVTGKTNWIFLNPSDYNAIKDLEQLINEPIGRVPDHYEEDLDELANVGIWIDPYSKTRVRALVIQNKGITKLPYSIGNLTELEMLYLANNQLENFPKSITKLRLIRQLDLRNNPLLPNNLQKMHQSISPVKKYIESIHRSL